MRYLDVDTPQPGHNEVLVRVKAVSICGSDSGGYKHASAMRVPPLIMGHEFSGEVAQLGKDVHGVRIGDRVGVITNLFCGECLDCRRGLENVCNHRRIIGTTMPGGSYNGAMAEYVIVPADKLVAIPKDVSFFASALAEPLSIALRAIKHAGDICHRNIVVFGAGPIGLMILLGLQRYGADNITCIDLKPERLDMAIKCGAKHVIQSSETLELQAQLHNWYGEDQIDLIFDAVGVSETVNSSIELVRNGGTIVCVGMAQPIQEIEFKRMVCKEITVKSSYMYTTEMDEALALITSGQIDVTKIVTGIYPMSEGARLFEEIANGTSKEIKIMLVND